MSSNLTNSVQKERESLTADIERIKLALQETEGDDSSEGEDTLQVDSEWEAEDVDEEKDSPEEAEDVLSTSSQVVDERSKQDYYVDGTATGEGILHFDAESGELPSNLETCLGLNRAYQEMITENIKHIELVLIQNRERQVALRAELEQQMSEKSLKPRRKQLTVYAKPYFKDAHGMVPPVNEDTKVKTASMEIDGYVKSPGLWATAEIATLREAVKSDTIQRLIRPLMNKKEVEMEKYKEAVDEEIKSEIGKKLDELQRSILRIQAETDPAVVYGDLSDSDKIDWMKISVIDMDGTRSAVNCELAWTNALHPGINIAKWKQPEDQKLLLLASKYECSQWEEIAKELGTNRTAFLCFQRYQTKVNPCLKTGKWTSEEDTFLLEVIESCREAGRIPWSQVAYYMDGRSREQCARRWDILNPKYKKGKWDEEEDMRLIDAVQRFGTKDWWKIKSFIGGRSASQIRDRWKNCLDLSIKLGEWTYEEDKKLWLYVQNYGPGSWAKVALDIPGRTDNACLQRYKLLEKWKTIEETKKTLPAEVVETQNDVFNANAIQEHQKAEKHKKATHDSIKQAVKAVQDINDLAAPVGSKNLVKINVTPLPAPSLDKAKAMLEKIAVEKLREERGREEMEKEETAADRAAGIYIPRPAPSLVKTRIYRGVIGRRLQLHNIIKDKVHQHIIKESSCPTDVQEKVNELVIKEEKEDNVKKIVKSRMSELGGNPTIKQILEMTTEIKIKSKKKPGRKPKCDSPDWEIENEIAKLLRDRVTKKRKAGRPRKFLVQDTVKGINPLKNKERSMETVAKIVKLLLTALNVDVDNAVSTAEKERRNRLMHPGYDPSIPAMNLTSKVVKNKMQFLEDGETASAYNIENDIIALETATGEKICGSPQNVRNIDPNSPLGSDSVPSTSMNHVYSVVNRNDLPWTPQSDLKQLSGLGNRMNELGNLSHSPQPLDLSARKHLEGRSGMSTSGRNITSVPPNTLPHSRPRRVLQGPMAVKAYGMPPLPPSCSTLNAFKQLLLKRRSLIKVAGQLSASGSMKQKTGLSSPSKESPAGGKTSKKGVKSKEKPPANHVSEDPSVPPLFGNFSGENTPEKTKTGTKRVIPITSEDINPAQLPGTLTVSNMLEAKDFLRKHKVKAVVSVEKSQPSQVHPNRPLAQGDVLLSRLRSHHDYNLLKARFSSLFLWPALLSTIPIDDEQNASHTVQRCNNTKGRRKNRQYPNSRGKRYRAYVVKTKNKKDELKASQKRKNECLSEAEAEPSAKKKRGRPRKSSATAAADIPKREPSTRICRATRSKVNYKEFINHRSKRKSEDEDNTMDTGTESQNGEGMCVEQVCGRSSSNIQPGIEETTNTSPPVNTPLVVQSTPVLMTETTETLSPANTLLAVQGTPPVAMTETTNIGPPVNTTLAEHGIPTVLMTATTDTVSPANTTLAVQSTPPECLTEPSAGGAWQPCVGNDNPMSVISQGMAPLALNPSAVQNVLSQVNSLLQQGSLQQMILAGQVQVISPESLPCINLPIASSSLPLNPAQPDVDPGQQKANTVQVETERSEANSDKNLLDLNDNTSNNSEKSNEGNPVNSD